MEINRPDVRADVEAAYRRYEAALVAADAGALDDLFWRDPLTIRLGPAENLFGYAAIAAFNARRALNPDRALARVVVTTYGADFATVATLYADVPVGQIGRQMQTWARMPEGWRVVAAHVSVIDQPKESG